jgi:hypothetical protein
VPVSDWIQACRIALNPNAPDGNPATGMDHGEPAKVPTELL